MPMKTFMDLKMGLQLEQYDCLQMRPIGIVLNGLLRVSAWVTSLTGAGAGKGEAADMSAGSCFSGPGSDYSGPSGGFCIGSTGATPATTVFSN